MFVLAYKSVISDLILLDLLANILTLFPIYINDLYLNILKLRKIISIFFTLITISLWKTRAIDPSNFLENKEI